MKKLITAFSLLAFVVVISGCTTTRETRSTSSSTETIGSPDDPIVVQKKTRSETRTTD